MKIVFMGTPDFAVLALRKLHEAGHEILLVVTQPDKPKGRSKLYLPSPVKEEAMRLGVEVFQPDRIKKEENIEVLKKYPADVFVVAAFGQILSKEILEMPCYGCINIHASLLPMYRGAAPIQWAILNGEKKSGVTIMQMDEGLDTGDMLLSGEVAIEDTDTADSLHDKLSELGADLIVDALAKLEKGEITAVPQPEGPLFYAKMIKKEDGALDFNESAESLALKVRAFWSWPATFALLNDNFVKVCSAYYVDDESGMNPGDVCRVEKDAIYVQTGKGQLVITNIQIQGKKAMPVKDFLLGKKILVGDRFTKYETV
ncbi:MAG: methionyl-tRNA formyltransferase [Lachnospiraceae bacterium]|nr:methionyl-tRNA formyltransferase [Lachnospiraceae bacterium]